MSQTARFTPTPQVDTLIDLALSEDIGCGDATSDALIPIGALAKMSLVCREDIVLCGVPVVMRVIQRFGPMHVHVDWAAEDGQRLVAGSIIGTMRGLLSEMLILERTLLNFLQRMSGVSTLTRRYVDAIAGTHARLVDTRKTLPGYRTLDKYATRIGGATNHRSSLDGGVLIKDNHLRAAGGIVQAIETARRHVSHALRIEVEVETMAGLSAAISAGADVIMLDNFRPEQVHEAVLVANGRVILEASGGIVLSNVRQFAETGIDLIAIGALTHSAQAVDIAAEVVYD
jgi:nicotinate-nucleotide pyrophosphorylase (carboxylating)